MRAVKAMMRTPILLVTVLAQLAVTGQTLDCDGNSLDILLLVDSSDGPANVRSSAFSSEKHFFNNIASLLFVNDNQFALQTYAHSVTPSFVLGYHKTLTSLQTSGIDYMWLSTGSVNEDLIPKAMSDGFASGKRPTADKVIILLTHNPLSTSLSSAVTQKLNDLSAKLVVVFVGTQPLGGFSQLAPVKPVSIIVAPDIASLQSKASHVPATVCSSKTYGTLQPWLSWTACDVTCGDGQRRRFRECRKAQSSDLDCQGPRRETENCHLADCTEPRDGMWSYWDKWSTCSKSCGSGVIIRRRYCNQPTPANGGLTCPGKNVETKVCADFECPDCSRTCPPGGRLSHDCVVCQCAAAAVGGTVLSKGKIPINNAQIYLQTAMFTPLATTDYLGKFSAFDVCMMNQRLVVQKEGYLPANGTATQLNATHWSLDVQLEIQVLPTFVKHPESKVRLTGQSVSLCCEARGNPTPTKYEWFKDDRPVVSAGNSNVLNISHAAVTDAGKYYCSVESDAGTTRSQIAVIKVIDQTTDSCGPPLPNVQYLPSGCHANGDAAMTGTIDVRTCGKTPCISRALSDNGTCSDWWPHYCCDSDAMETKTINCDGFSYNISAVKSCKCMACIFTTTLSGRVIGRQLDGTEVPLQFGTISVLGKDVGITNMKGFFKFDVPKTLDKVVLNIKDTHSYKFIDTTKIFPVSQGSHSTVDIIIPLRPKPIDFHSNSELSVDLGTARNEPKISTLRFPPDSLITHDGKPYTGRANASIHMVDPRRLEDIQATNGNLECEVDGEKAPLETFGMFAMSFEDDSGNKLHVNKPVQYEMDASLFEVPLDEDGNPDIYLWSYDKINGVWVQMSQMRFVDTVSTGRRRLLAVNSSLYAQFTSATEQIEMHIDKISTVTTWVWTNCDHSRKKYFTTAKVESGAGDAYKYDACVVSVSIYEDLALRKEAGKGIIVYAYSKNETETRFKRFDSQVTDANGHACLAISCYADVYIYAEWNGAKLIAAEKQNIIQYSMDYDATLENSTVIKIPIADTAGPGGPIYARAEETECPGAGSDRSKYRFQFAPFTKGPELNPTISSNVYNDRLSWYPVPPEKPTRWSCFMKAMIKVKDNYNIRFIGTSFAFQSGKKGDSYGSHDVGPIPASDMTNRDVRAACIQFRCPGLVHDGGKDLENVDTLVEVNLTPTRNLTCRIRPNTNTNINVVNPGKSFSFKAESGNNYGSKFGIFMGTSDSKTIEQFCYNGRASGSIDGGMKPDLNPAVTFECS